MCRLEPLSEKFIQSVAKDATHPEDGPPPPPMAPGELFVRWGENLLAFGHSICTPGEVEAEAEHVSVKRDKEAGVTAHEWSLAYSALCEYDEVLEQTLRVQQQKVTQFQALVEWVIGHLADQQRETLLDWIWNLGLLES